MIQLFTTLQILGARLGEGLDDSSATLRRAREERGSVTIEQVLWAVAAIAIAGIVVAAVRAFVTSEASQIR